MKTLNALNTLNVIKKYHILKEESKKIKNDAISNLLKLLKDTFKEKIYIFYILFCSYIILGNALVFSFIWFIFNLFVTNKISYDFVGVLIIVISVDRIINFLEFFKLLKESEN